jgi:hypothetical protein
MFAEANGLYGLTPKRDAIDEYGTTLGTQAIHGAAYFLVGNGPSDLYAATGVHYGPVCVPTSTCSSEYTPAASGHPASNTVIETISVSCISQPTTGQAFQVEQQMGNGSWVALGRYNSNLSYPTPPIAFPEPGVAELFDPVNSPAAGSVVNIRVSTTDAAGNPDRDPVTPVTITDCSQPPPSAPVEDPGAQGQCEAAGGSWVPAPGCYVEGNCDNNGKCIKVPVLKCGNLPC